MRRLSLCFCSIILSCLCAFAMADETPTKKEDPVPQNLEELKEQIEKIRIEAKVPAIGVALVNLDGPLLIKGFGEINVESHQPTNEDTLFRIGSTSKMFASLSILKLVEQGKISLDDSVKKIAPEVQFENQWEATNPIKIVHLLEHTTGWDDMHLTEYAAKSSNDTTTLYGLNFHPHSRISRWVPGSRMSYCNAGPAVAAYIVEKITGQRYEDYVKDNFFTPLQMNSTSYFYNKDYETRGATLYNQGKAEDYWHLIVRASGSINSSPKDMAKFVQFYLNHGKSADVQLISPESITRMETPESLPGAKQGITAGFGLGNYTSGYKNSNYAFHGHNGAVLGGFNDLSYSNELGIGYAVMINNGDFATFDRLGQLLRSYILKDAPKIKRTPIALPETFKNISGYYRPLSPRNEIMHAMVALAGIIKITDDGTHVHRSPLFGGRESKDYAENDKYLIDSWSGLPSIAWVNDPKEGKVLQTSSEILKPISIVEAFGGLILFGGLVALSLISILCAIYWIPARLIRKQGMGSNAQIRLWPMLTGLILISWFSLFTLAGADFNLLATTNFFTLSIFTLSLAYPASAIISVIQLVRHAPKADVRWQKLYATIHNLLHVYAVIYLAYYSLIGVQTWA